MKRLYVEFADFDEEDCRITLTEDFDADTFEIEALTSTVVSLSDNTHDVTLSMENVLYFSVTDVDEPTLRAVA